jgi:hypothetical protein
MPDMAEARPRLCHAAEPPGSGDSLWRTQQRAQRGHVAQRVPGRIRSTGAHCR